MPTKRERQPHGAAAAREVSADDMSTAELPPVCVLHTLLIIIVCALQQHTAPCLGEANHCSGALLRLQARRGKAGNDRADGFQ